MTVGSERLDYGHLGQAHTDGDIFVFLPASNVLVAGDVLTVGKYPIADYTTGGWLGGMVTATKTLIDMSNADTRIIPGTGPVQTRADLQSQYDMLNTMRDRFAKMMRQGMGASDMLAAGATKDFDEKWGDPKLFCPSPIRHVAARARTGGIVGQGAGQGVRCAAFRHGDHCPVVAVCTSVSGSRTSSDDSVHFSALRRVDQDGCIGCHNQRSGRGRRRPRRSQRRLRRRQLWEGRSQAARRHDAAARRAAAGSRGG
jgi:hypothetical protein